MSPKVSIIMPVFNAERYLRPALESVRQQTSGDFECICVDDGSTDGSAAIVEEYQRRDDRFRLIRQEHRCAGVARNAGMSAATGECLAFLDADDWYEPDFLEEMLVAYEASDHPDIVVCGVNCRWEESGRKERGAWFLERDRFEQGDRLNFTPGNPWNKLISRKLVIDAKLTFLALRHSEDVGFVFPALACAKKIRLVDKPLVNYRLDNAGSLEHMKSENGLFVFYEAYLQTRDRLVQLGVYDKFRASFLRRLGRTMNYNLQAPRTLKDLEIFVGYLSEHAAGDFGFLRDVPTTFDVELKAMQSGDFEAYLVRRLKELRSLEITRQREPEDRASRRDERQINTLMREIKELKVSESYRIGMAVTWLPRFVSRLFARKIGLIRKQNEGFGHHPCL